MPLIGRKGGVRNDQERVALNVDEVEALDAEIERLITEHAVELESGFVVESASKLRRIGPFPGPPRPETASFTPLQCALGFRCD